MAERQENADLSQSIYNNTICSPTCARISLEDFVAAARVIGSAMHGAPKSLRIYFVAEVGLLEAIVRQFVEFKTTARRCLSPSLLRNGRIINSQPEGHRLSFDNYCAVLEYLGNLIMFPNLIRHSGEQTRRYTPMDYEFLCCKKHILSIRFDRIKKRFFFTFANNVDIME